MVRFEDDPIKNEQAIENTLIISINGFLRYLPISSSKIKILEIDELHRPGYDKNSVKVSLSSAKYYKDGSSVYTGSIYVPELDTGFKYHIMECDYSSPAIMLDYFIIGNKKIRSKDIKTVDTFILKNTVDKLAYWATRFYDSYTYGVSGIIFDLASDIFKYKTYLDLRTEKEII